ncbi:tyrosine--tRNA ligase [Sulfuracidifex tepidarius]|uniref:Tyrosine--tRNA ligase n=1 Tax=Sulfuracidifex tepidarius TaxID=1294262 RepID=A0A510DWN0_9CREN|nr:tyrosine--tRNA ligase [Sulfuracidifex tepidarius]BBG24633.1 Tyrosine--tRNA ligase [Sulfuracidifex tepidarius]BBG27421.1 Tyrosine--tRNA ligase [Sulfuracidifex tepidarius]
MNPDERLSLITRNLEEIVTTEELKQKLESGQVLKGYIGFEPSGLFHIGWLIWAQKVKDLTEADVKMNLLEATWHAWINDKLGGDLQLIKEAGKYAVDVLETFGIDRSKINVVDAEDLVGDKDYWKLVIKISKNTSLARMKRAMTIMGRNAEEAEIDTSKLIYPAMQVADIYYMDLDIALGGTDQRKAHMLARDLSEKMGAKKVISLHTPLLVGLQGGERMNAPTDDEDFMSNIKMSKSKPENAVFINDPADSVESKIMAAYCPRGVVENNPILQINKFIIFPKFNSLKIERDQKYGGDLEVKTYNELESLFAEGKLHPMDLKKATARKLNEIIEPMRQRLNSKPEMQEIVAKISKNITR